MQLSQLISFGRWLDNNIARIVRWAAFFGLVAAFISWAASYITPIYQYGWGAVVFAGVGAACVIALVGSGILVAWRYFNPLPEQSPTPLNATHIAPTIQTGTGGDYDLRSPSQYGEIIHTVMVKITNSAEVMLIGQNYPW
jgi:hypothetical protein